MRKIYKQSKINVAEFEIILQYKNVKNFGLKYNSSGSIILNVPLGIGENICYNFILRNIEWLRKTREKIKKRKYDMSIPFDGQRIWINGIPLYVFFIENTLHTSFKINSDNVTFYYKRTINDDIALNLVKNFYKKIIINQAQPILNKWQNKLGVEYTGLKIRYMKTRWGSCNINTGVISLNLLLSCFPYECLEYVIVHELTHLLVPNHSKNFYDIISKFLPDWEKREDLLKEFNFK